MWQRSRVQLFSCILKIHQFEMPFWSIARVPWLSDLGLGKEDWLEIVINSAEYVAMAHSIW